MRVELYGCDYGMWQFSFHILLYLWLANKYLFNCTALLSINIIKVFTVDLPNHKNLYFGYNLIPKLFIVNIYFISEFVLR